MKIYFANALFSQADFDYNTRVVATLRQAIPTLDIYLPQENAAINDKEAYANSEMIAQADTEQLVASDLVIAVLDGQQLMLGWPVKLVSHTPVTSQLSAFTQIVGNKAPRIHKR